MGERDTLFSLYDNAITPVDVDCVIIVGFEVILRMGGMNSAANGKVNGACSVRTCPRRDVFSSKISTVVAKNNQIRSSSGT